MAISGHNSTTGAFTTRALLNVALEQEKQIREFVRGRLENADIAHGFDHVEYVVNMARKIALREGADLHIVIPAAYLHDLVNLPKDAPDRHTASTMSADAAAPARDRTSSARCPRSPGRSRPE